MPKTKKYSLAYWARKCMNAWSPEKDILAAVQEYAQNGAHTQIEFSGTPLELATALYLERFKRGTPWQGFFPTPARVAAWAADLLPLNQGAVVLDPGCGFGALSQAVQQRGARPILVEYSNVVVPIAQAIWGEAQVHYRDFLDGFRPTEFDAVITNPPFGNVFGHSDAAGDFLERIAELSRGGLYVAAILPRGYLSVDRPKRRVEIAQRFTIIEKHDLAEDTFAPLTKIATTLYLLTVRRDGELASEVLPRAMSTPASQVVIDQPSEVTLPKSADTEPSFTQYQIVQEKQDDFVLIRGLHQTAGWVVVQAFPPENRVAVLGWFKERGVDLQQVVGGLPRFWGETFSIPISVPISADNLSSDDIQSPVDKSKSVTPLTVEPPALVKSTRAKREKKPLAPEPRVEYPAIWHKQDKFEFHLDDGAIVKAEYDGADSIGFEHGDLHYSFHGPSISTTGFRSYFAKFADVKRYSDPVNAAIAIASDLATATAKEVAKQKKKWPMMYAGDVAVRIEDGSMVRGTPISWNDFNQWWYVWLIETRTGRAIKPDEIVGAWPTSISEASAVSVCPQPPSDGGLLDGAKTPSTSDGVALSVARPATAQPVKPIKRPVELPADIPEIIEVDVGGRTPHWIAAAIVKVTGGKQLMCRRSDGHGEFKTPIYGRDITWRVPISPEA